MQLTEIYILSYISKRLFHTCQALGWIKWINGHEPCLGVLMTVVGRWHSYIMGSRNKTMRFKLYNNTSCQKRERNGNPRASNVMQKIIYNSSIKLNMLKLWPIHLRECIQQCQWRHCCVLQHQLNFRSWDKEAPDRIKDGSPVATFLEDASRLEAFRELSVIAYTIHLSRSVSTWCLFCESPPNYAFRACLPYNI